MAKQQYRITTVSWLDGKATTKVFNNAAEALETYRHLVRGTATRPLFATLGARGVTDYGDSTFKIIHAYISPTAASMQGDALATLDGI